MADRQLKSWLIHKLPTLTTKQVRKMQIRQNKLPCYPYDNRLQLIIRKRKENRLVKHKSTFHIYIYPYSCRWHRISHSFLDRRRHCGISRYSTHVRSHRRCHRSRSCSGLSIRSHSGVCNRVTSQSLYCRAPPSDIFCYCGCILRFWICLQETDLLQPSDHHFPLPAARLQPLLPISVLQLQFHRDCPFSSKQLRWFEMKS